MNHQTLVKQLTADWLHFNPFHQHPFKNESTISEHNFQQPIRQTLESFFPVPVEISMTKVQLKSVHHVLAFRPDNFLTSLLGDFYNDV